MNTSSGESSMKFTRVIMIQFCLFKYTLHFVFGNKKTFDFLAYIQIIAHTLALFKAVDSESFWEGITEQLYKEHNSSITANNQTCFVMHTLCADVEYHWVVAVGTDFYAHPPFQQKLLRCQYVSYQEIFK